jgi:hypothetical protein
VCVVLLNEDPKWLSGAKTFQPAAFAVAMYPDERASDEESGETVDVSSLKKIRGPTVRMSSAES